MVVALLVVAASAFIGPMPANAETASETPLSADAQASWACDTYDHGSGDRVEYNAYCTRGQDHFRAVFHAHGEHLKILDSFPNDHHTYAYLDILDTPYVDYTRHSGSGSWVDFNLSISDGTRISLKVCSSQTSGARCSPAIYGRA
jgi:hypothetical protein